MKWILPDAEYAALMREREHEYLALAKQVGRATWTDTNDDPHAQRLRGLVEGCAGDMLGSLAFYEGEQMGGGPYNPSRVTFAAIDRRYLTLTVQQNWWPENLAALYPGKSADVIEELSDGSQMVIDDSRAVFMVSGHLIRQDGQRLSMAEYGARPAGLPPPLDVRSFRTLLQRLADLDFTVLSSRPPRATQPGW